MTTAAYAPAVASRAGLEPKFERDTEGGDGVHPSVLHAGQLVIENEGSVCRDFLAYERNYLAWVKLSATCLVIAGALILRLHLRDITKHTAPSTLEEEYALPMGVIFFIVAILGVLAATTAFFSTQRDMLRNLGHVSSPLFTQAVSFLTTAVIGISCVLLIISTEETTQA